MANKSKQCNFRLTDEELNALKIRAEQEKTSRSAFVHMCVCKELGIGANETYKPFFSRSQIKIGANQELQSNNAVIGALCTQLQVLEKLVLRLERDVSKLVSHQCNDSQTHSMANKSHERAIVECRNHLHEPIQKPDEELIFDSALNDKSISTDGADFIRESADLVADHLSLRSDAETDCPHTPISKFQKRITQAHEAKLIELVHNDPPAHRSSWSYRLLAKEMLERGYVAAISHEKVRQILKDHNIDLEALAKEKHQ